jgi:citrate synthase
MPPETTAPPALAPELHFDGTRLSLPLIEGTEGERAIDIAKLRDKTGLITLDPGFGNTGACTSSITFIDGDRGILRYRGYPIEELAAKSTFLEVAWLLIKGELPTNDELAAFSYDVTHHTMVHEYFGRFLKDCRRTRTRCRCARRPSARSRPSTRNRRTTRTSRRRSSA